MNDSSARVSRELAFLLEADKLKWALRRASLIDYAHQETRPSTWHAPLAATVLGEQAKEPVDPLRRATPRPNSGVRAS